MPDDIVISLNGIKYVIDNEFKNTLISLIKSIHDADINKQVRLIKTCLCIKYNLNYTIYKEKKILEVMLKEFFDDKVLYDVLVAPFQLAQKKYYEKNKSKPNKYIVNKTYE